MPIQIEKIEEEERRARKLKRPLGDKDLRAESGKGRVRIMGEDATQG